MDAEPDFYELCRTLFREILQTSQVSWLRLEGSRDNFDTTWGVSKNCVTDFSNTKNWIANNALTLDYLDQSYRAGGVPDCATIDVRLALPLQRCKRPASSLPLVSSEEARFSSLQVPWSHPNLDITFLVELTATSIVLVPWHSGTGGYRWL